MAEEQIYVQGMTSCYEADKVTNEDFFQFYSGGWVESMNISHNLRQQPKALARRQGLIVWVTFMTEMTRLIKG